MRPTTITADKQRSLLIVSWDDGRVSEMPFTLLSEMCPCASCSAERNNPDPLRIIRPKSSELEAITPVGSYAVSLIWKNGCRYGIYSWDYLRELESRFLKPGDSTPSL